MDKKKSIFPNCPYMHGSCFAYLGGKCILLTNTRFKDREDCPFYKDKTEGKEARSLLLQDLDKLCKKEVTDNNQK